VADDVRINDAVFEAERFMWQQLAVTEAAGVGAEIARTLAPVRRGPGPHGPRSAYYGDPAGGLRDSIESWIPRSAGAAPAADFGTRGHYVALARWRAAKYPFTAAYAREGKPRGVTLYLIKTLEALRGALAVRWS
jgi:hypothetical protein